MANKDATLSGLRNSILTSLFGRKLGLDPSGFLLGPPGYPDVVSGAVSTGSTCISGVATAGSTGSTSTVTTLPAYGVSAIGTTVSSGNTGGTTGGQSGCNYQLDYPVPGVSKLIVNPTTGDAGVFTKGAYIFGSSFTPASTYQYATLCGNVGAYLELMAITTAVWWVTGKAQFNQNSTGSTALAFV